MSAPAQKATDKAPQAQPAAPKPMPPPAESETGFTDDDSDGVPSRRVARRRPAGPVRNRIAANDDAPSIGGLIYALNEKPSQKPFQYAAIASGGWAVLGLVYVWLQFAPEMAKGAAFSEVLSRPTTFLVLAAIVVPIALAVLLQTLRFRHVGSEPPVPVLRITLQPSTPILARIDRR